MQITAGAAPACGAIGATKVASKTAAIETIKAGYDRYIITNGLAQNNVSVVQGPGHFNTFGTVNYGPGFGTYNGTTTYSPGPTFVVGSHDEALAVVMFKPGDPGFENAIDARAALGENWQDVVKHGVHTCL